MSNKRLSVGLLVCASLLSSLAHSRSYDDVISSGYINIGVYRDFPPFSFEKDGQPAGVDIEIGKKIAEELGVKFKVHWITPDENLEDDLRNNVWKGHYLDKDEENPMALKNLADVMMRVPYDREFSYMRDSTGAMINEQVVMFGPYQSESWQVAYDSRKMKHVTTVAVFQYHPIGVEIDSLPAFYLTSANGGRMREKTHHYVNATAAYEGLEKGEVSAVMAMRSEVDWLLFSRPNEAYKLGENSYPAMGKQQWDIGMAIQHSYRQLGYAVEDVVDKMVRSGQMEEVFKQYGLRYEKPAFYKELNP
ncbi:transporter substrate-binding domain-containing protein [Neptuniibacter sp. CAU 1671]|uniref:substrate-binding periplasmic protein n=1 Tax=Neptuniibacter sp. CAU 1671 TaxID=3032593 RepID=UPI0023DC535C|nr:transporter substrate-binding domain-containing protein [Neptuniibacter sp. CAU 1671]MDF2180749.1 transporter substrate-binding domain-containing protein [Neptuniibacter sp. CAU 1671]